MKDRMSEKPIDSKLCEFSLNETLLIKSRLFYYREGLSVGRPKYSWSNIASEISNLPANPDLSQKERAQVVNRFRYYLLTVKRRRKSDTTAQDIAEGNFPISDDMLHRWYEGQPEKNKLAGKKPYTPPPQKLAAIRDFLLVKKYLHEEEFIFDKPTKALAFILNEEHKNSRQEKIPEFTGIYLSYSQTDHMFNDTSLHMDTVEGAGYVQFLRETRRFEISNFYSLKRSTQQASAMSPSKVIVETGWVPLGLMPSIVFFTEETELGHSNVSPAHFKLTAASEGKIMHFELHSLKSYQIHNNRFIPQRRVSNSEPFVSSKYEHIFDFFEDKVYTSNSRNISEFVQFKSGVGALLYSEEDLKSGRALFEEVCRVAYDDGCSDYQAPVNLINSGAAVNYQDSRSGYTTLHVAAERALRDTVLAMVDVEGLDFLVTDRKGRLPSDLAFRVSGELGALLSEKQAEQATKRGLKVEDILKVSNASIPSSPDSFEP